VLITGGQGNDTFDLGYGNATVKGGDGWDQLILPGSISNYEITGTCQHRTIERDGYLLTVINVEELGFPSLST
jgi:hypothetical protein